MNLELNDLFGKGSFEYHVSLESSANEENDNTTRFELSDRALKYRENKRPATASIQEDCANHDGGLDTASLQSHSVVEEPTLTRLEARSAAEDEPLFDADATSRGSSGHKQTRLSSVRTVNSGSEVLDITSEPELDNPRPAKRHKLSKRRVRTPTLDRIATPKPMPPPTLMDSDSCFETSSQPSPSLFDDDGQSDSFCSSLLFAGDFVGDSSGGNCGEQLEQVNKVSDRPSVRTSPRHTLSGDPIWKKGRCQARTTHKQSRSKMPTRVLRSATSYRSKTDDASCSRSLRATSLKAKEADVTNNRNTSKTAITHQISVLTHHLAPEGSSIMTATVHCSEPILSADPTALYRRLLSGEGRVIHMVHLSLNSWMLLGYRYDHSVSGSCRGKDSTLLRTDLETRSACDAVDYDGDLQEDADTEYEEDPVECEPCAGSGHRTNIPWLESDGERLLSYRDKMKMEWDMIVPLFPGRSPRAVKLRYYMLRK